MKLHKDSTNSKISNYVSPSSTSIHKWSKPVSIPTDVTEASAVSLRRHRNMPQQPVLSNTPRSYPLKSLRPTQYSLLPYNLFRQYILYVSEEGLSPYASKNYSSNRNLYIAKCDYKITIQSIPTTFKTI